MDNLIDFPGKTRCVIPVEKVLSGARENVEDELVVIGWKDNGDLYFASTHDDTATVLFLLEVAKRDLLSRHDD